MEYSHSRAIVVPGQLSRLDDDQERLFNSALAPVRAQVEALLLRLRLELDERLALQYPVFAGKAYPLGRCREIRDAVFARLAELLKQPDAKADPALAAVQGYIAAGGTCRKIWGDLRGEFFQNALQLGGWYVDVANDTVNPAKPRIEILPLGESGFGNIGDYEHFIRLAVRYWKVDVYANTVFPALAPLLPLVCQSTASAQRIWLSAAYDEMIELTRREAFLPSERILAALPPAPDSVREYFSARVPDPAPPLLAMTGDSVEACRSARANNLMSSNAWRTELIKAFLALNKPEQRL